MGVHARTRRGRLAAAVSAVALTVSGGFVTPLLTAGPAHAAPLPPWNQPASVGGDAYAAHTMELTELPDGSAVALWREYTAVYAAVRGAGSDLWDRPQRLGSDAATLFPLRLVTGADGVTTALWAASAERDPGAGAPARRLMTAAFRAGVWAEPKELLGAGAGFVVQDTQVAAGPQGTATAVWSARPLESGDSAVYATTRGADGTWSAPVPVAAAGAADGSVDGADVAVDTTGTAVIAYRRGAAAGGPAAVETVTRTGPDGSWGAPAPVAAPVAGVEAPNIGSGPDGSLALTWPVTDVEDEGTKYLYASVRKTAATGWGAASKVPITDNETTVPAPEPLIAPDGDVTLVWWEWHDLGDDIGNDLVASTLTGGSGRWSREQISTGKASPGHDASIGTDGTVRVLWTSERTEGRQRWDALTTTARTADDDTWSAPAFVPHDVYGGPERGRVQIAAGSAGSATALWNARNGEGPMSARTRFRTSLAVTAATVPTAVALAGTTTSSTVWKPVWQLNQPAAAWTLTLSDPAGKVVKTLTGSGGTVAPRWNGRGDNGAGPAANGPLTWRLTARAQFAPDVTALGSGKLTVTGGAAVRRDAGGRAGTPDGTGDLLSTTASGGLRAAYGNPATGNFAGSSTTTGWPRGFLPVPVGDMSGDRCNDTLVRLADGAMRRYTPACGAKLLPGSPYKVLGKGWNAYDVITSPGDLTGDGRPELIARDPKTGTLYRYDTVAATGLFAPRVSLGTGFKGYKKIVGAGDLNGDGRGDLLLQDASNELWRMNGNKLGKFDARALLATGWGAAYNAVVGAGDLTGDGRADLVARDTAGKIWRMNGTGKGTFGTRVQLGTGWHVYRGIH